MNHFKTWLTRGIGKKNFLFLDDGDGWHVYDRGMNFYGSFQTIEGFVKMFKAGCEGLILRRRLDIPG